MNDTLNCSEFVLPPLNCRFGKALLADETGIKLIEKDRRLGCRSEKTIPISDITSVVVRKNSGYHPVGFIELTAKGNRSPNRFVFAGEKSYRTALKIKEYIYGRQVKKV